MLTEDQIVSELNAITDNMAYDSEDGRDSDAEDNNINVNKNPQVWSLYTRSSSKYS